MEKKECTDCDCKEKKECVKKEECGAVKVEKCEKRWMLGISATTGMKEMPATMGKAFKDTIEYTKKNSIVLTTDPMWADVMHVAFYTKVDLEKMSFTYLTGYMKTTEIKGYVKDDVVQFMICPEGNYVTTLHKGPYSEVSKAYDRIKEYAKKQELVLACNTDCYEWYMNDPRNAKPEELLTQVYWRIDEENPKKRKREDSEVTDQENKKQKC